MAGRPTRVIWYFLFGFQMIWGGSAVTGQDHPDRLTVYGGATFFNRPELDSVVLVEFPFTLSRDQFEFFQPSDSSARLAARIFAQINLNGIDNRPTDSASTYFSVEVSNLVEAAKPGIKLFNSLVLAIPPGIYSGWLTIIDVVSKKEGRFDYQSIVVEPTPKNRLFLGSKCLAYRVRFVGDDLVVPDNSMPKNGLEVLTNPLGIFSSEDTVMCFYGELHNLEYHQDRETDYRLSFTVEDRSGTQVSSFGVVQRTKSGSSAVVTETLDIGGYSTGSYRLKIAAVDLASGQVDTQLVAFHIISPDGWPVDERSRADYDPADTLKLDIRLRLAKYFLTPEEKGSLAPLTDAGKASFLDQYWREHDSDPTTVVVEDRLAMVQRYNYCNQHFSSAPGGTDGWDTDRGRIYMTYGPWDDRINEPHPIDALPYLVWNYRTIEEGAVFIFQDKHGLEDYRLVHSNIDGEIFSKWWNDWLVQGVYDLR